MNPCSKINRWLSPLVLILLIISSPLYPGDVKFIKDPKPTHVEKHFVKLVKVWEIPSDIDKDNFMAVPGDIAVDDKGSIFVFDVKIRQIFKFDKNYKFVKSFGTVGQGPGEFSGGRASMEICFSNKHLYVSDTNNKKLIVFDTDGNHIRDIKLPYLVHTDGGINPAISLTGDFFVRTGTHCTLDAYNINDRELKKRYSLLGQDDCGRFIIQEPVAHGPVPTGMFTELETFYDILPGNRLIVYLANSSTIYIFEKKDLVRRFEIRPKEAMEFYRQAIARLKKKKKSKETTIYLFRIFFTDKDNENYFYLDGRGVKIENGFCTGSMLRESW